jgi:hypothetical protein
MLLNVDELKYLRNLIAISGDLGCIISVGDMTRKVNCNELHKKIDSMIIECNDDTPRSSDLCECGHLRIQHIYAEGACRPGFVCECSGFKIKK